MRYDLNRCAQDLAAAGAATALQDALPNRVLNVGGPECFNRLQMARTLAEVRQLAGAMCAPVAGCHPFCQLPSFCLVVMRLPPSTALQTAA